MIELSNDEKQFIRDNKDLIDQGDWNWFFDEDCSGISWDEIPNIYQFIMFEAKINLLHKMSYIPSCAFWASPYEIRDLVIPSNIEQIWKNAFQYCKTLTSIDLSETKITELPAYCFHSCTNLRKVILPKTCSKIDKYSFMECKNLETINLENVEILEKDAFADCSLLRDIDIRNLKYSPNFSFRETRYKIKSVIISKNLGLGCVKSEFPDADIKVI